MLTTFLMFIAAIVLSTIAGYYSVIGMTAIFSGAFVPIVLMAGTLETSKIIVASWLYNNWKKTPILLKSYLTIAVVVLMFITSMGIFGYLSKAHIQQAGAAAQQVAQVERLGQEIKAQEQVVELATKRLGDISNGAGNGDAGLNARITQANKVIENANARVQPKIDEQQTIIDQENAKIEARTKDIQTQIADIDQQVSALDEIVKGLVDQQRSVLAQKKRAEQATEREDLGKNKAALIKQIDGVRNAPNSIVDAAKAEIAKIRAGVDEEVKQAQGVINELTGQLGKNVDTTKLSADIDEQNARIKAATDRLDELTAEKFKIETETRKLEVEVGPIKYIAQMIYGDNVDGTLLEKAVRWIIMTLIFVFDPLAVLMLIASNQGLAEWKASRTPSSRRISPKFDKNLGTEPQVTVTEKADPESDSVMLQIKAALDEILPRTVSIERMVESNIDRTPIIAAIQSAPIPVQQEHSIEQVTVEVDSPAIDTEDAQQPEVDDESQAIPRQEMVDTMRRVLFNAIEEITTTDVVPTDRKMEETTQDGDRNDDVEEAQVSDPSRIGQVDGTDDLLNKLQRVHAVRLQKFNAKTI